MFCQTIELNYYMAISQRKKTNYSYADLRKTWFTQNLLLCGSKAK